MNRLREYLAVLMWFVVLLPVISVANQSDLGLHFTVHFDEKARVVEATVEVRQSRSILDFIEFAAPESRFSNFRAEGKFKRTGDRVHWRPPRKGGKLRYVYRVDNQRDKKEYDARFTDEWVMVRLDRVFPGARTRTSKDTVVSSTLQVSGPKHWTFETRFGRWRGQVHNIPAESRSRYRSPTGWTIAGEIGTRRDAIAGRKVAVAGPKGNAVRRQDLLAFVAWTLPELVRVFPDMPASLLIVSANDPMWRGGLSGPGSYYLHADRPLITENGTSPVLHELIHVASRRRMADGEDWLVEGLAEYYSLLFLRRSGGITEARFNKSLHAIKTVADQEGGKLADPSRGADTARATIKLADLDRRLPGGLDAWIKSVPKGKRFDCASLEAHARKLKTAFWGCQLPGK